MSVRIAALIGGTAAVAAAVLAARRADYPARLGRATTVRTVRPGGAR